MNECIVKPAERSGAPYYGRRSTGEAMFGTLCVDLEKFAELIVRECAAYADEMWPHQKEFKGTLDVGQGIRRKFGL